MKELKDYLPLYTPCKVFIPEDDKIGRLSGIDFCEEDNSVIMLTIRFSDDVDDWTVFNDFGDVTRVKPILRPLSSMNQGEMNEYNRLYTTLFNMADGENDVMQNAACTHYLLSKHFDLFGLIEAGLALDATKMKES